MIKGFEMTICPRGIFNQLIACGIKSLEVKLIVAAVVKEVVDKEDWPLQVSLDVYGHRMVLPCDRSRKAPKAGDFVEVQVTLDKDSCSQNGNLIVKGAHLY